MTTTTSQPTSGTIVLPAALQHLIVPILSALAVFGGGLPTLFGSVDAAHGNALIIAAAYVSYGGIVVGAVVTFWVIPTWLKLLFAVLGLLGTIVSPFLLKGTFDLRVDGPVLLIAIANGLLTAFGQYVRTQATTAPIDARETNVVTSLPAPGIPTSGTAVAATPSADVVSALVSGGPAVPAAEPTATSETSKAAAKHSAG